MKNFKNEYTPKTTLKFLNINQLNSFLLIKRKNVKITPEDQRKIRHLNLRQHGGLLTQFHLLYPHIHQRSLGVINHSWTTRAYLHQSLRLSWNPLMALNGRIYNCPPSYTWSLRFKSFKTVWDTILRKDDAFVNHFFLYYPVNK